MRKYSYLDGNHIFNLYTLHSFFSFFRIASGERSKCFLWEISVLIGLLKRIVDGNYTSVYEIPPFFFPLLYFFFFSFFLDCMHKMDGHEFVIRLGIQER